MLNEGSMEGPPEEAFGIFREDTAYRVVGNKDLKYRKCF